MLSTPWLAAADFMVIARLVAKSCFNVSCMITPIFPTMQGVSTDF
ncbi:hypothetical protein [Piscirickettsia salmonis]|nr:hypothetical protein [Piscirickettsia salmonis]